MANRTPEQHKALWEYLRTETDKLGSDLKALKQEYDGVDELSRSVSEIDAISRKLDDLVKHKDTLLNITVMSLDQLRAMTPAIAPVK